MTIRTTILALSGAMVLGGCAPRGTARVTWAPEPGERHLVNIQQLTFGGNNAESYFSADGQQLIFQRQTEVDSGCDQEYVMNIDGTNVRRVSNGRGRTTCGYFIEKDKRILYSSTSAHDSNCPPPVDRSLGYVWPLGHFEMYTANLDGSDTRQITNNGFYNAEGTVSPDGKTIIFTSTRDGDIELYVMGTDGSNPRRITHRVGYDGGAFFSPDGTQIVWRAQYPESAVDSADYRHLLSRRLVRPAMLELWMANADGSNPHQVTHFGGANFAPFFHPDGKRIIFASNFESPRGRNFDLFIVRTDGTGLEKITMSGEFDGFPMFSPDGKRLVFASNRHGKRADETNLFIADWKE